MRNFKTALSLILLIGVVALPFAAGAENGEPETGESMLRAAIFVQNRAGKAYQDKVDVLNDLITARLTERGFSVLDKQYVLDKFREARDRDAEEKKIIEALSDGRSDLSVEEAMKDTSALRLAQMIGADYIIVAALTSLGHTEKKFSGKGTIYGVDNEVTEYTLRVALRVLEAAQGGSVYGDVVRADERIPQTKNLEIVSSDVINSLLDTAAGEIAANIGGRTDQIRAARVEAVKAVPFSVAVSGADSALIELDGAVIGSAGTAPVQFLAPSGIHMLRVSQEWFTSWARPVNIIAGQKLNITLQLSDAGIARFKNLEGFKEEMMAAREKSEADAYAKRLLAEGEKKRLEESYEKIDTSKVERLSVGDKTPRVIVEEEGK